MLYRPGYSVDAFRELWREIDRAFPNLRRTSRRNIAAWLHFYSDAARVAGERTGWWEGSWSWMSKLTGLSIKEVRNVVDRLEGAGVLERERPPKGSPKRAQFGVTVRLCRYEALFTLPVRKGQGNGHMDGPVSGQGQGQHEDLSCEEFMLKDSKQQRAAGYKVYTKDPFPSGSREAEIFAILAGIWKSLKGKQAFVRRDMIPDLKELIREVDVDQMALVMDYRIHDADTFCYMIPVWKDPKSYEKL